MILLSGILFLFVSTVSATNKETPALTYPIYGGWNPYDTYQPDWIPGSDNVVWNFGNNDPVYRLKNSLSLRYNPNGEFHMISSSPPPISTYKWLSFVGRADSDLDFEITLTDAENKPIGIPLNFTKYGGKLSDNYWTQYNFPIADFKVDTQQNAAGFRITQLSSSWGAMVYLDEIYFSSERGEDVNPALPTRDPAKGPTPTGPVVNTYPPQTNPLVYIIPLAFALIIIMFH